MKIGKYLYEEPIVLDSTEFYLVLDVRKDGIDAFLTKKKYKEENKIIYDVCALYHRESAREEISLLPPDAFSFLEETGEDEWGNTWYSFNEEKYFEKVCEIYALFLRKSAYYKEIENIFGDVLAEYAPYNIDGEFSDTDYKPYEGLATLNKRIKALFFTLLSSRRVKSNVRIVNGVINNEDEVTVFIPFLKKVPKSVPIKVPAISFMSLMKEWEI